MNRYTCEESECVDVGVGPGISRYGVFDNETHSFVLDLQQNYCPECAEAMNRALAEGKDPEAEGEQWIELHKKELVWYK